MTKSTRKRTGRRMASGHSGPSYAETRRPVHVIPRAHLGLPLAETRIELECQSRRVYGDSPANVAPRLVEFRQRGDRYRQRFESTNQAIPYAEAKAAIELFPRINPASSIGLSNAALVDDCIDKEGRWNGHAMASLAEVWQYDLVPWERYRAQAALAEIAKLNPPEVRITGTTHDGHSFDLSLADALRHLPCPSRPRGRHDDRANMLRDVAVCDVLRQLEGCGLPVTSGTGESLVGAMAEAWGIPKSTIANIWRDDPTRTDKKTRIRRCARCGKPAGEVARRDDHGDRLCCECMGNEN